MKNTNYPIDLQLKKYSHIDLVTFLEEKNKYISNNNFELAEMVLKFKRIIAESEEIIARLKIKEQQINQLVYELQKQKEY